MSMVTFRCRHFGCPKTTAKRDVRVIPFSPKTLRVSFNEGDCISPDLGKFDTLLLESSNGQFLLDWKSYLEESPAPPPPAVSFTSPGATKTGSEPDPTPEERERDSEIGLERLGQMWGIRETGNFFTSFRSSDQPAAPPSLTALSPASPLVLPAASPLSPSASSPSSGLPVLRYSVQELLQIALDASDDAVATELFDLGRADAFRWLALEAMRDRVGESDGSGVRCRSAGFGKSKELREDKSEVTRVTKDGIMEIEKVELASEMFSIAQVLEPVGANNLVTGEAELNVSALDKKGVDAAEAAGSDTARVVIHKTLTHS